MLLMIDNYDCFTYNLVQYFGELGEDVRVARNDEITLDEIAALRPDRICISPGPCTPNEAGISIPVLERFAGKVPILGVCLGHQAIGAGLRRPRDPRPGADARQDRRRSTTRAPACSPACRIRSRRPATTRWRSSARRCRSASRSPRGRTTARSWGCATRRSPVEGVQFHPESIATEHGHAMLKNFLNQKR